jgi:hypothetical protein
LNNNRGNNNRRRGRPNNNRPQNGGQNVNRIDSRARGNAPQLLEKYRKLAQDAHLNGDRVQAEYYLQFADHYFRVIADARVRQDETRARRDDRWQEGGEGPREDAEDSSDFSVESDFPTFDTPVYTRREREEREDRGNGNGQQSNHGQQSNQGNQGYQAPRRREEPVAPVEFAPVEQASQSTSEDGNVFEPAENPFLRENRGARGLRPRREDRRPRREDAGREGPVMDGSGLEASLPPSISTSPRRVAEAEPVAVEADAAPAPKRRVRRKPVAEAGESAE